MVFEGSVPKKEEPDLRMLASQTLKWTKNELHFPNSILTSINGEMFPDQDAFEIAQICRLQNT